MNSKRVICYILFLFLISFSFFSCGKDEKELSLRGKLGIASEELISGPLFIAVADTDDPKQIEHDPVNRIHKVSTVNNDFNEFNIDLSETSLNAGDEVFVFAFADNDYSNGIPFPDKGDVIGFYINPDGFKTMYRLKEGDNNYLEFSVNREVYDFKSKITGTVNCHGGDCLLIAYTGTIDSLTSFDIDIDKVIGYERLTGCNGSVPFQLDIFPYGCNVPIVDVLILALHDVTANGIADRGDRVGYIPDSKNYPLPITIEEGILNYGEIPFFYEIGGPSGYKISIQGEVKFPESYDASEGKTWVILSRSDDIAVLMDDPVKNVLAYYPLETLDTSYFIDVSNSAAAPGDRISVFILWDRNSDGGMPDPDAGDIAGIYINKEEWSMSLELSEGVNSGIDISLDRQIYDYNASVSGTILGDEAGDVLLVALAGEINSLSASDIEFENIIAYKKIRKGSAPTDYTLEIMPYGRNLPIEDVYIIALLDRNKNGKPDAGDLLGFCFGDDTMPHTVDINSGNLPDIDLDFRVDVGTPSGYNMSISGYFDKPDGYSSSSDPVFIAVVQADDTFEIFNDPLSTIRAFSKLGAGENHFDIDISDAGLVPGDEVRVLAVWDRNYRGGFPYPDAGDIAGYFQNKNDFSYSFNLRDGVNSVVPGNGWSFNIDKPIYSHNSQISFQVDKGPLSSSDILGKMVTVVAAQANGIDDSMHWWDILFFNPPSYAIRDMDYIISIDYIRVTSFDEWYTVDLFPFIYNRINVYNGFNINDVYIYAILDSNDNGWPDAGEYLGYYYKWLFDYIPKKKDRISDGVNKLDNDIRFTKRKY